ncbi:cytochrome d ubiquinol oxidase subunit II [Phytoactinopolyspora alkaliphila]|uniref:Cytochrome d ubiquinol oxidase subunit II n=1 Tax=Phytoactinopolyspora alkaliphila TaxID=1783498 RepID=A0A6N9YRL1_9ACTN|nr:cytochrome d ubiquinol oxidase subunit II [Phytoactinopolyspora alkaliphila]NED97570.1 cytochrome d ubiquinol oxidase subunit II [Phytoactinopolyspora alkaliphila]
METLAVVTLAFYVLGYFVLGGADLGTGMMLPFLARNRAERRLVVAAIVPFFLTSEVWLIASAGLLIGFFPALEGELVSGLFPLIVVLLAGWVTRDAGVWFRGRVTGDGVAARSWRAGCDAAICAGSWLAAGAWAWILSGMLGGTFTRVLTDPAVIFAVLAVLVVFGLHGLAFAALRLTGAPQRRAAQGFGAMGEKQAFALTAAALMTLVAAAGSGLELTGSAADPATLAWLVPAALALTPLLMASQVWVWWLFGRRVFAPEDQDNNVLIP